MTVKEFDIGQRVFILNMHEGRNSEPEIREESVISVGRKYVTVENGNRYASEEWFHFGLVQSIDYGERSFLCPSKTDAYNYIEFIKLQIWISSLTRYKVKNYTLEQLRKVKEILMD